MRAGTLHPDSHAGRLMGPGSSAIKYDILTALLVTSARGDALTARLALRLSLLITARYNWRSERFAVGQTEMASMWGVTTRTAKRDLAVMRTRGWITVARPSARGRVAEYRISFPDVLRETMPHWDAVGPDFVARMTGTQEEEGQGTSNVVPLHPEKTFEADGTAWAAAAAQLQKEDPVVFSSWFASLRAVQQDQGTLTLIAPGRFQADYVRTHFLTRLLKAVVQVDATVRCIEVWAPDL